MYKRGKELYNKKDFFGGVIMHKIDIEAEIDVLTENKRFAKDNRRFFNENEIIAINIMGAVGSGKTTLIEKTILAIKNKELGKELKVGAILGDVFGDSDFKRVSKHSVIAEPLNTGKECHLDAHILNHTLHQRIDEFKNIDLLLIENVGNLICPSDFDLGETYRVVIVSVTEGEDVIEKHPLTFVNADVIIINKVTLANLVDVDVEKMVRDAKKINSKAKIIKMDLKDGIGIEEWINFLRSVLDVSCNTS